MATFIVLLGPPGAGKGTQAEVLAEKLDLAHISSGDLFRENLKNQTELGKMAQGYMNRGELVPDDVTIAHGPRAPEAARLRAGRRPGWLPAHAGPGRCPGELLAEMGSDVQVVPYISVPAEVLIERLSGRWTCRAQGHVYHEKYNPPKAPGKCDIDGSELYQREDDKPETVKNRISVYDQQTSPLIEYYRNHGVLVEVDGTQPIEKVTEQLLAAVEKR